MQVLWYSSYRGGNYLAGIDVLKSKLAEATKKVAAFESALAVLGGCRSKEMSAATKDFDCGQGALDK